MELTCLESSGGAGNRQEEWCARICRFCDSAESSVCSRTRLALIDSGGLPSLSGSRSLLHLRALAPHRHVASSRQ
jgi:hypothetical protein